jgi:hypothetical protein
MSNNDINRAIEVLENGGISLAEVNWLAFLPSALPSTKVMSIVTPDNEAKSES